MLHRHEEVFALIMILLERHHLKKHSQSLAPILSSALPSPISHVRYPDARGADWVDASVSEHFYQLHLTPTSPIKTPRMDMIAPRPRRGLNRSQRWGMLFFLVGFPYLRIKAQQKFERLRNEEEEGAGSLSQLTSVR